jgi:uracil-DNA glycosylase family 4
MSSFSQIAQGIQHCHKCRLHEGRQHAVPGSGPVDASVVFIGEAPGKTEDLTGLPFQGAAGHFLSVQMAEAKIPSHRTFLTNCVKCRPPNNRKPYTDELTLCKTHWLLPQLESIKPALVVLLGEVAIRSMLGIDQPIQAIHGRLQQQDDRHYLPTYHPAAAMRFPAMAAAFKADLNYLSTLLK